MATSTLIPNYQEIIRQVSGEDLIQLCRVNKDWAAICRQDRIWQEKVLMEYPGLDSFKPGEISWRQFYLLNKSSEIPAYLIHQVTTLPLAFLNHKILLSLLPLGKNLHIFVFKGKSLIDYFTPKNYDEDMGSLEQATSIIVVGSDTPDEIEVPWKGGMTSCSGLSALGMSRFLQKSGIGMMIPEVRDWEEFFDLTKLGKKVRCSLVVALLDLELL